MALWPLSKGASPDTPDRRGRTPLYHAVPRREPSAGSCKVCKVQHDKKTSSFAIISDVVVVAVAINCSLNACGCHTGLLRYGRHCEGNAEDCQELEDRAWKG